MQKLEHHHGSESNYYNLQLQSIGRLMESRLQLERAGFRLRSIVNEINTFRVFVEQTYETNATIPEVYTFL